VLTRLYASWRLRDVPSKYKVTCYYCGEEMTVPKPPRPDDTTLRWHTTCKKRNKAVARSVDKLLDVYRR